ncbi:pre-mRNA-splicing factor cef1 [Histoplasma capsulatum G186AR]|uniref:Pre-mRNA-splicing factor cef1 n=1 Tax=Ajellomyces capsulatus (strain G186AR / H82 / ATCC MYA-2454 / RMSCC 2432) TaxID=447093 RepID=C0NP87_AJECG|nr:pre-mRNA-splicing factor cef1 [Histoplasma capsulatum G186AR]EEH06747.1 pre-mRNA-splicing factor cef1 [Histoplasma capsulatum G186AR]
MPVVKGGVWTNIEDEIVKVAVSKYGLNQWARVSSLLARKTPKQCKARWAEWLDPAIRKIEWSREEDEKLLHLAKLMPTQWRTIAPIVGRTATQCLERYQKLLDEAEARESDELGLGGPAGGETAAPSADDVRRLRPGELDPDPESKPARPDTIDLDEDEKEMLSEARARLANTQGKKAKRKARERQLEESRRLAVLQKRRELKNAGINIKVVTRKKGQMDYNADIPFEKQPAPGFYDTLEEESRNERQRALFDPRKQQLASKRKGDQEEDPDRKRRKNDKSGNSAFAAAAKAGQMQKIREAEQSSKRRALVLPSPQVSETELEEIVKMGMAGERASKMAGEEENDGTRGLISNYSTIVGGTPIRTPRAPAEEDRIANEIRNIKALTETQSSLLGGENTPLHEGGGSTGFEGIAPRKHALVTPNPMATPFRQAGANGIGATPMKTPMGVGATPLRTPRDNFAINKDASMGTLVGNTPKEMKLREDFLRRQLSSQLSSLPAPKEVEWELEEMPTEQAEPIGKEVPSEEDAAERDRRNKAAADKAAQAEFERQSQVYKRGLPRPSVIKLDTLMEKSSNVSDPIQNLITQEMVTLIAHDARKFPLPGARIEGKAPKLTSFSDAQLARGRAAITSEVTRLPPQQDWQDTFTTSWSSLHESASLPGLSLYSDDDDYETQEQQMIAAFENVHTSLLASAEQGNKLEKKISLHNGGYQARAKTLRAKIIEASEALEKARFELDAFRTLQLGEESGIGRRLEGLRDEVTFVTRREREAQELYKSRKEELESLEGGGVNGWHR